MIIVPDRPLANSRQESARECDDDVPSMFSTEMMYIITITMVICTMDESFLS